MKTKSIFVIAYCLLPTVYAQDFKQALLDMYQTIKETKRMHIVMDISVFENTHSTTPYYHDKAEVNRDSNSYLYHYNNMDFPDEPEIHGYGGQNRKRNHVQPWRYKLEKQFS